MAEPNPAVVADQLSAATQLIDTLWESFTDLQRVLDRDTAGWQKLATVTDDPTSGFTADFRRQAAARSILATAANPLIRRGVNLRIAYVWGDGVTISVDDIPDQGQDVNRVVQAFLDDAENQQTWTSLEARADHERDLCQTGEVWLCLPTDPVTGRVRVRKLAAAQITTIWTDPEDESSEWLYLREWTPAGTSSVRRAWYPRLGYRPAQRPQKMPLNPERPDSPLVEIRWDQPVLPIRVNRVGQRGLGDLFAAVPWADAYKGFLEDWRHYMRSLVQYTARLRTRGDKVGQAKAEIARSAREDGPGSVFVSDPNTVLEGVPSSGAKVDADSGRPLAAMVAAGLDIPVTTLLGDPGVTGARATAETVSSDSEAVFRVRRAVWTSAIREVCGWVIDAAVIAPAGQLRGTIVRNGDRQTAQLPAGDGRTVKVGWPESDDTAVLDKVKAVQALDTSELAPPKTVLRLYLWALGVADPDEIVDQVTDEQGNYVAPAVTDATVRAQQQRAGLVA